MPSVAQGTVSPLCGRKRRREDGPNNIEMQMKLSSPHLQRASIPEPAPIFNTEFSNTLPNERKQLIPRSRRHDQKRQRVEPHAVENDLYFTQERYPHNAIDRAGEDRKPKIDLSPCHICRRKPTVKSELDAFADCEGCARRTCYICIRECPGWGADNHGVMEGDYNSLDFSFNGAGQDVEFSGRADRMDTVYDIDDGFSAKTAWKEGRTTGHRRMVCSRCCVEKGTEGEVCCLGCLRAGDAG